MTVWSIAWLWWGFTFLLVELTGVAKHITGSTLSEHVWQWFSVSERRRFWLLRRMALWCFLCALGRHFLFHTPAMPSLAVTGVPFALVILSARWIDGRDA